MNKLMLLIFVSLSLVFSCERPKEQKEQKFSKEKLFEFSERCSNAGKIYFQDFVRQTNMSGLASKSHYLWDEPEYHYNSRLNTCLIHIRYVETTQFKISYHYNQVVDIFSNKTILRGWFSRDTSDKDATKETILEMHDGIPNYTSEEYFKQKDKLFGE